VISKARRFLVPCALSLVLVACAGNIDGGASDAGLDAGPRNDAAPSEGGAMGALQDAATGSDARTPDASQQPADASRPADASQPIDGARPDATSPTTDAATRDAANADAANADAANAANADAANADAASNLPRFSFFVTSLSAMRQLSGSQDGFGGDLTFGETGEGAGLRGADKICTTIAEMSLPGSGAKGWHAFLSTASVDARDRIGDGPWYDRQARIVASTKQALLTGDRPQGAHSAIVDDLPNERGEPNQAGSAVGGNDDNHDTVTATNTQGVYDGSPTCDDWTTTTTTGTGERRGPGLGHSWPAMSGQSWREAHRAPGCGASVNISPSSGAGSGDGIGNAGGYGGIYCFADVP
jgi:hypothetical protein